MNDLSIPLDAGKGHLYLQIYNHIKNAIRRGELICGERLPSTRLLASFHGISRSTAQQAYDQLLAEGYVESRPCSGFYVCKLEGLYHTPGEINQKEESLYQENGKKDIRIDFSPNVTELVRFPFDIWRKLIRDALREEESGLFTTTDPKGDPELRTAICRYMNASRGVNASPSQIIIGAGNDYLLMLIVRMMGDSRVIAMDDPTYKRAALIFRESGYAVYPFKAAGKGEMDKESLTKASVDLAYVMPGRHFPMGHSMNMAKRLSLLSWASEGENRFIIEDDYDSEFRFKGSLLPSLQSIDTSDSVIYIGTFSKAIAPTVRISYMVLPKKMMPVFEKTCGMLSTTVSRTDQNVMCNFINEGHFERHLNRMRSVYRQRQDTLISTIKEALPDVAVMGEGSGLHVVIGLDINIDCYEMKKRCRKRDVGIYTTKEYKITDGFDGDGFDNGLILGYGALNEDEILEGIQILKEEMEKMQGKNDTVKNAI